MNRDNPRTFDDFEGSIVHPHTDLTRNYVCSERRVYADGVTVYTYHKEEMGHTHTRYLVFSHYKGWGDGFAWLADSGSTSTYPNPGPRRVRSKGWAAHAFRKGERADHSTRRVMAR